jgi:hypothetical protein
MKLHTRCQVLCSLIHSTIASALAWRRAEFQGADRTMWVLVVIAIAVIYGFILRDIAEEVRGE